MKRLCVPLLICACLATASTAVSLETDVENEPKPSALRHRVEERLQALEEQVRKLELESSRQSMVIERQAETIRKLKQSPAVRAFPVSTPQNRVPHYPLPEAQSPVPQHPSTAIPPHMPQGTEQRWINGMPFYLIPCSTGEPVAEAGVPSHFPGNAAVLRNGLFRPAVAGAVVLPDESLSDAN